MAVYSMTGYGSATHSAAAGAETGGATGPQAIAHSGSVTVDIRSVNGRFLDLSLRLPDDLRGLEPALRELIGSHFRRGKIEVRVSPQRETDAAWPQPSPDQLNRLSRLENTVHGWLPKAAPLSVHEALQWCRGGSVQEKLDDLALVAAQQAVAAMSEARAREGARAWPTSCVNASPTCAAWRHRPAR